LKLLEVTGLKKFFPLRSGISTRARDVKALDGIDFDVVEGETFGLVGESGCGKTTLGRCILRLVEPTAGKIHFNGLDILAMDKRQLRAERRNMQIVFQDPYSSLDPRLTIAETLEKPLKIFKIAPGNEESRVVQLLKSVGLEEEHMYRFPHEFSGGQRQRIAIARTLATSPKFIVLDEPTSALDVSVQAMTLNLLRKIQTEHGLTYLFISHNIEVIKYMSDRIAVMYLGKVMEIAPREQLFRNPLHPYTQALLSAVPIADPDIKTEKILLKGDAPSPINPPKGCPFHTRCPKTFTTCSQAQPELVEIEKSHYVACHLYTS
jgi:oligopeptide/dipeptide ABC transporter ATP-binding protein